jgi:glycosyltransferase involved in cell wall biosynthesis
MAMKKCVVATREATRALAIESGRQLWIANDARSFADAIAVAIRSPDRQKVMDGAREYVERHHDWATIMSGLDTVLARLVKATPTQGSVAFSQCTAPPLPDRAEMRGIGA